MRSSAPVSTSAPTRIVRPPTSTTSMVPDRAGADAAGTEGGGSLTGTKPCAGDAGADGLRRLSGATGTAGSYAAHAAGPPPTPTRPARRPRPGSPASAPAATAAACRQSPQTAGKSYLQT